MASKQAGPMRDALKRMMGPKDEPVDEKPSVVEVDVKKGKAALPEGDNVEEGSAEDAISELRTAAAGLPDDKAAEATDLIDRLEKLLGESEEPTVPEEKDPSESEGPRGTGIAALGAF